MPKSTIIKANEKIANKVVKNFQKISDKVVTNHRQIENCFVDRYLTKDGENIEEAKARLHQEKDQRKMIRNKRKNKHL